MSVETILCVKAMCENNFLCKDLERIIVLYIKTHLLKNRVNDMMYQGFSRLFTAPNRGFHADLENCMGDCIWDMFIGEGAPINSVFYPIVKPFPEHFKLSIEDKNKFKRGTGEMYYVDFDEYAEIDEENANVVEVITEEIEDFEIADAETW